MSNQDDNSGWPSNISQIKWAMRHGQKIDGLENMVLSNQPVVLKENQMDNMMGNNSNPQNVAVHNTVLEEQINQLGQTLNYEILSLKNELAIVAQGAAVEEQIGKLGEFINQEILSLGNEFAIFAQTQLNQKKVEKLAQIEWENSLNDREIKLQTDLGEIQLGIMEKLDEYFQYLDAQLQDNDNIVRQELSLLTSQLTELQNAQGNKEELQVTTQWQRKLEERQTQLIEDVDYMQYVLEEIATRPQSTEAQQKLREKFFIREISALKEQIAAVCLQWKVTGKEYTMTEAELYNKGLVQQGMELGSEDRTKIYKKMRKRR